MVKKKGGMICFHKIFFKEGIFSIFKISFWMWKPTFGNSLKQLIMDDEVHIISVILQTSCPIFISGRLSSKNILHNFSENYEKKKRKKEVPLFWTFEKRSNDENLSPIIILSFGKG